MPCAATPSPTSSSTTRTSKKANGSRCWAGRASSRRRKKSPTASPTTTKPRSDVLCPALAGRKQKSLLKFQQAFCFVFVGGRPCGRRLFARRGALPQESVPEVVEGQRQLGHFLAQERHGRLQIVALGTGDAHRIALDGGLHLHLGVLDDAGDLLGVFGGNALAHLDHLLDLVAADLFDLADVQK